GVVALQPALWMALAGGGIALKAGALSRMLDLLDQCPTAGGRRQHLLELLRRIQDLDSSLVRCRPDDAAAQAGRCQVIVGRDQRRRHLVAANAGLQAGSDAQAAVAQIQSAAQPALPTARMHLDEQLAGEPPEPSPWAARAGLPARRETRGRQLPPAPVPPAPTPPAVQQ